MASFVPLQEKIIPTPCALFLAWGAKLLTMPLSPANKYLSATLLLILASFFFLLVKPSPQLIEFEKDDVFPLIIDQSSPYENKLVIHGVTPMLKMEVKTDYKVAIYVGNRLQKCKSADCEFVFKN